MRLKRLALLARIIRLLAAGNGWEAWETLHTAESSLGKDWDSPEEDAAWAICEERSAVALAIVPVRAGGLCGPQALQARIYSPAALHAAGEPVRTIWHLRDGGRLPPRGRMM
jgi:hypothetical protein